MHKAGQGRPQERPLSVRGLADLGRRIPGSLLAKLDFYIQKQVNIQSSLFKEDLLTNEASLKQVIPIIFLTLFLGNILNRFKCLQFLNFCSNSAFKIYSSRQKDKQTKPPYSQQ